MPAVLGPVLPVQVPVKRVVGMRVTWPCWEMRCPGLGPGPEFFDEEQMHTESGLPPTPPLQPGVEGSNSFQMGPVLSGALSDAVWVSWSKTPGLFPGSHTIWSW